MTQGATARHAKAVVATARCTSYELDEVRKAVRRCVDALPQLQEKFRNAGNVLLKPNLLSTTRGPDRHVNTHPAVVRALAELLIGEYGCRVAVGDSCGSLAPGATARALEKSGIVELCGEVGARVYDVDKQPRRMERFDRAVIFKDMLLPANLDEFDLIVSVAKLKTHSLTGVTGPVKNMYGLIPGAAKKDGHLRAPRLDAFAQLICDVYDRIRPGAAFVDGIVGMEGNGPSNGALRRMELVAAGADPVALDSFCAQVMGFDPMRVPLLAECRRRGLGRAEPERIEVRGEPAAAFAVEDFARPSTFASGLVLRLVPLWLSRGMVRTFTSRYANVNQDRCVRCGECARNCPSKAISFDEPESRYSVDKRECISCYCCAEVCPADAIEILPTLPVRALRRIRHPFRAS